MPAWALLASAETVGLTVSELLEENAAGASAFVRRDEFTVVVDVLDQLLSASGAGDAMSKRLEDLRARAGDERDAQRGGLIADLERAAQTVEETGDQRSSA